MNRRYHKIWNTILIIQKYCSRKINNFIPACFVARFFRKFDTNPNFSPMKKLLLSFVLFFTAALMLHAQDEIVGRWKTIDDETGKAKSIIEIYKKDGKYYGRIVQLLTPQNQDGVCRTCETDYKDKNIIGLVILKDLVYDADDKEWEDGTIMDPKNAKEYSVYLELVGPNKLKVRGYIGFSLIGRTQYWYRVE